MDQIISHENNINETKKNNIFNKIIHQFIINEEQNQIIINNTIAQFDCNELQYQNNNIVKLNLFIEQKEKIAQTNIDNNININNNIKQFELIFKNKVDILEELKEKNTEQINQIKSYISLDTQQINEYNKYFEYDKYILNLDNVNLSVNQENLIIVDDDNMENIIIAINEMEQKYKQFAIMINNNINNFKINYSIPINQIIDSIQYDINKYIYIIKNFYSIVYINNAPYYNKYIIASYNLLSDIEQIINNLNNIHNKKDIILNKIDADATKIYIALTTKYNEHNRIISDKILDIQNNNNILFSTMALLISNSIPNYYDINIIDNVKTSNQIIDKIDDNIIKLNELAEEINTQ